MSKKELSLTVIEQKEVVLYDNIVFAVLAEKGGKRIPYIPLKPICDNLGVAWQAQLRRVNRDSVLAEELSYVTVRVKHLGSTRGTEMACLPLDYLNGWLFGINASRVKSEVKEQLIRYQKDCYRVLSEAFQSGKLSVDGQRYADLLASDSPAARAVKMARAILEIAEQQLIMESQLIDHEQRLESLEAWRGDSGRLITPAQQSQISQAVKAVALELGKHTQRNEFGGVYGELYRRYQISGYQQLPGAKFDDAIGFLRDWFESLTDDTAPF